MDRKQIMKKFPKGQTVRLNRVIRRCIISFVIGLLMLVFFYIANFLTASAARQQKDNILAMDQFRFASKKMSSSVQSYAAYKNDIFYDAYMTELKVEKNREKAMEFLMENHLQDSEVEELNKIFAISNSLVPIELEVLELKKSGDSRKAVEIIYGTEYQNAVNEIEKSTDKIIQDISTRLEKRRRRFRITQHIVETLFFGSFMYIGFQVFSTIRFARKDLLAPILQVSDVMHKLCKGNLHIEQELPADDSEVGRMVNDIDKMQHWMSSMIFEISHVLKKMGDGDFVVSLEQNYLGDFQTIKDSFETIADQIRESMRMLQNVADEVNGGSLQLAQAADGIASACTTQAGEISDIILLMNELNEIIVDNKRQAEEAVKISNSSAEVLMENGNHLQSLKQVLVEQKENMTNDTYEILMKLANNSSNNMEEVSIGSNETTERILNIVMRFENEIHNMHQIEEKLAEIAGIVDNNSATSEETAAISEEQKAQVEILVELLQYYKI